MRTCLNHPLSIAAAVFLQLHVVAQTEYQEFISAPGGDTLGQVYFYKTPDGGGFLWLRDVASDARLIRVDAAGLPQWTKRVATTANPAIAIYGVAAATPDNGLVFCAGGVLEAVNPDSAISQRVVMKVNSVGQMEWTRRVAAPVLTHPNGWQWMNNVHVLPDGAVLIASGWFESPGEEIEFNVIKLDSDGLPLWSFTRQDDTQITTPDTHTALLPDGSLIIASNTTNGTESVDIMKIDVNGQMLWHKHHIMNNAPWTVWQDGMVVHPGGNFAVHGTRNTPQLYYDFIMWFTPDGELYRHRLADLTQYGVLAAWNNDGIWKQTQGAYALLDSTGSSVAPGFLLESPGTFGGQVHTLGASAMHIEPDSFWMAGVYSKVTTQFGYTERRPFLMRSAIDPFSGCRLVPSTPLPIDYLDVPDSLMTITTEGPMLPGPVTHVDTALALVDLPLNTTYDFCSIVSVEETEPTPDAIQLWPDPVAQGAALNIQSTVAADLTIFDTRGRVALRNNELLATRVVNTASLAKGTYMAVGCDKKGVRLWSRPFVVL